jgi:Na+/H+ antiporter NhaB
MTSSWQIILAVIIVGLSILMPIYYLYKKKKLAQQLKEGREVTEREKIRVYMNNINEKFRAKRK